MLFSNLLLESMNKRSPERTPETTSPSCPIARDRAMATREICERSGAGTGTSRRKRARSREHGSTRNRVAKLLVGDDDVLLLREAERLSDVEFCTKWYLSQRASRRLREATLSACAAMATMQARGELVLSDAPPEDDEQYMHRLFCGDPEGGVGPKPPSKENNYTRDYCADFVNVDVLPLRRPRDDRLGTLVRAANGVVFYRPPQSVLLEAICPEKRLRLADAFRELRTLVVGGMGRFATQELSKRYSFGVKAAMQKGERGLLNSWRTRDGVPRSTVED